MRKSELAEVLRSCLPTIRMLDNVNIGVIKVGDDLIYLKRRYGAEIGEFITWEDNRGFNGDYKELYGKNVIFSLSLLSIRGKEAVTKYLDELKKG